ncbi:hypothetical protein LCGC14_2889700, partial [marine sediment metagenome]
LKDWAWGGIEWITFQFSMITITEIINAGLILTAIICIFLTRRQIIHSYEDQ